MLRVFGALFLLIATTAAACACPTVPKFSTRVERASLPLRPESPVNGGELETYRMDWETARVMKIEGFNKRRQNFAVRLQALEQEVDGARKNGQCTKNEAGKAKADIQDQRRIVNEDMQLEYEDLLVLYKSEQQWCSAMISKWKKCRAAGRCGGGFEYA